MTYFGEERYMACLGEKRGGGKRRAEKNLNYLAFNFLSLSSKYLVCQGIVL
jgi:hypothetical protein